MTLNPWKRVRQLRCVIQSLQACIATLQKVIATQGQMITLQQTRIDLLTAKASVEQPSLDANKFIN
jgi:uncharacterized coiled-coil protein SlyX